MTWEWYVSGERRQGMGVGTCDGSGDRAWEWVCQDLTICFHCETPEMELT